MGTIHMVEALTPSMADAGRGKLVMVSSAAGILGLPWHGAYSASKAGIIGLGEVLRFDLPPKGIDVHVIAPGAVDTPLVRERLQDPQFRAERLGEVPLGRLATASDVAYAVLYLASEEASFINGAALPIDGGVTCY